MLLSKAKEIIEINFKEAGNKMPPDVKQALELAIGAINIVTLRRQLFAPQEGQLIPGETPDKGK